MSKHHILVFFTSFLAVSSLAQNPGDLHYFLPQIEYREEVPDPEKWLGFKVGDWHVSHDQLLGYMKALDAASDRVSLEVYGYSHEKRPLVCLTITHPSNFNKLDEIKSARQKLAEPTQSKNVDIDQLPAVYYMGYSIHGNEASGSNAAMLVAYYLAAGQSAELDNLLNNTVILFDPCFNPDGLQRFSSWINSHKSKTVSTDPSGDEYNEPWPRGRTNHYGFDLNRDWLVCQQPESVGRVRLFQAWKPNLLTDHHEMGSNATFFFQPGVVSRINPITPAKNLELTSKIAKYHSELFSQNKVLFYTKESFDDFYYGKGSTYPDVQGAIGILFEQASSRGSAQETDNGILTFQYSIKNQVLASFSSLKAVSEMRVELNKYLREFYTSAIQEARNSNIKGYAFGNDGLPAQELANLLKLHSIKVFQIKNTDELSQFSKNGPKALFVPIEQAQYRLIRGIFERPTQFLDSVFYDISAWTLPDAFGLNWHPVTAKDYDKLEIEPFSAVEKSIKKPIVAGTTAYSYVMSPVGYDYVKNVISILNVGIRTRVAMEPFSIEEKNFDSGSILIHMDRQPVVESKILEVLNKVQQNGADIEILDSGMSSSGPDLGSAKFPVLKMPKIAMIVGEGVSVSDAGEVWHQLDTRFELPMTLVDQSRIGSLNLNKYNTIILPDGNFPNGLADKIKQFTQDGGTVITTGKAMNWLKNNGIIAFEPKNSSIKSMQQRPYANLQQDKASLAMPGAIFEASLDLSHPICFGYYRTQLPVFFGDTLFVNPGKNVYSTPVRLTQKPLLAGYVHANLLPNASNAAGVMIFGVGRGKVIAFPGNPNFRSFWYGTNRLFGNAILLGHLISSESIERK